MNANKKKVNKTARTKNMSRKRRPGIHMSVAWELSRAKAAEKCERGTHIHTSSRAQYTIRKDGGRRTVWSILPFEQRNVVERECGEKIACEFSSTWRYS